MQLKKLDLLGKPYKIYAEVLESGAIDQFVNCMSLPDVVQGALMPDAHTGYVMPIGAVVATKGTIYPSFVGYDIGCGMSATKLNIGGDVLRAYAKQIYTAIQGEVPVGFSKNTNEQITEAATWQGTLDVKHSEMIKDFVGYGPMCLGTLGGGNHFIEIGEDEAGMGWIIIHSGSRSVGQKIAEHYMKIAADGGKAEEAHALGTNTIEGVRYIADMEYGLQFALKNRQLMTHRVIRAISGVIGRRVISSEFINRNHNHAELRDGRWIHRKGATHAEEGMMGVIPGNMRDGCFIVRGLGNPDSLYSSSHGAGRVLSRRKAKEQITLEQFEESMKGVWAATVGQGTIDESPFAYKDIFKVMELQEDLVDIVHYVKPIINVKG